MSVEVEMRLTLKNCRDVRGETPAGTTGKLAIVFTDKTPIHVELSISEKDARELWTQIGLKLRGVEKS